MATARLALKQRREQLDLSQEQVAHGVGVSTTTYRSWESGNGLRVGRRRRLAEVLEWSPAQLNAALDGATAPNGHAVPSWLGHLASLEQAAARLSSYEPTVVHGLLQTQDYAAAVERADIIPRTDEGVARRVEVRMARQGVLTRQPDPLALSVILDESVLHRVAGNPDVMGVQLDHLADLAQRPNIELQVLPLDAGVFSAAFGAFTVLTSPGSPEPYMAVIEDRAGPHYLDRPHEIEAHVYLFEGLSNVALSPAESIGLIYAAAKEYR